jgi:phosphoribosylformylglycinamidine synthase
MLITISYNFLKYKVHTNNGNKKWSSFYEDFNTSIVKSTLYTKMSKIGITVFPGSNCDRDVHYAFQNFFGIQTDMLWHTKDNISNYDAIIIPGGFAYGDRLRAGVIAARSPIMCAVKRLAKEGIPILGICNGFQILVEAGILPGALTTNNTLQFVCGWTTVKITNNKTPFTNKFKRNEEIIIPIAHGEGRYIADDKDLRCLKKKNRIVLKYTKDDPNGSTDLIAGICNTDGNVMGMMPHPERAIESILVPDRISNQAVMIFTSLLSYLNIKHHYTPTID